MGALDKLKKRGGKKRNARLRAGLIGLVTILIAGAAVAFALQANTGNPTADRHYIRAAFSDTGDIHVDGDVREAAIRIGRIDSIDLENGQGVVTLQIDDAKPFYNNATAQIVSRSGLGQKFLNVTRGDPSAGVMNQYGTIPVAQTSPSVEILDLSDLFTPATTRAAQSSLQQLGAGLQGHTQDLRDAFDGVSFNLPRLRTVAGALNSNNGADVNRTLTAADSLSSRFAGREQQLTDLNRQLATTLDAVDVNRGRALQSLLEVAPPSFRDVRKALLDLQAPLETTNSALVNIRPAVGALAVATPDTRGVLRESITPLGRVPNVAGLGTPALASLVPVLRDLQPFAPRLTFAVDNATVPVNYLAPRSSVIAGWFSKARLVISKEENGAGDANGNWAPFDAIPSCGVISGATIPIPNNNCPNSANGSGAVTNAGSTSGSGNALTGAASGATRNLPLVGGGR